MRPAISALETLSSPYPFYALLKSVKSVPHLWLGFTLSRCLGKNPTVRVAASMRIQPYFAPIHTSETATSCFKYAGATLGTEHECDLVCHYLLAFCSSLIPHTKAQKRSATSTSQYAQMFQYSTPASPRSIAPHPLLDINTFSTRLTLGPVLPLVVWSLLMCVVRQTVFGRRC